MRRALRQGLDQGGPARASTRASVPRSRIKGERASRPTRRTTSKRPPHGRRKRTRAGLGAALAGPEGDRRRRPAVAEPVTAGKSPKVGVDGRLGPASRPVGARSADGRPMLAGLVVTLLIVPARASVPPAAAWAPFRYTAKRRASAVPVPDLPFPVPALLTASSPPTCPELTHGAIACRAYEQACTSAQTRPPYPITWTGLIA